jgi:hypothetical protein
MMGDEERKGDVTVWVYFIGSAKNTCAKAHSPGRYRKLDPHFVGERTGYYLHV